MTTNRARVNRKTDIVRTTEALLSRRGLSGVTTRAIAEAVPCSEGAIYVHFKDRLELILAVLEESLPAMLTPLHALEEKLGSGTPADNLSKAVQGLLLFHERVAPMLCSLFAEAELLRRFRQSLAERDKGPHRGIESLARYIRQEQAQGRISPEVDAKASAGTLMASCFFHVFTSQLLGTESRMDIRSLVKFALKVPSTNAIRKRSRV